MKKSPRIQPEIKRGKTEDVNRYGEHNDVNHSAKSSETVKMVAVHAYSLATREAEVGASLGPRRLRLQ